MDVSKVFKKDIKYRSRKISNRYILMGIGESVEVNELGFFIWENLDAHNSISDIIDIIFNEYDCPRQTIENDVIDFIKFLFDRNLIKEVV